MKARHRYAGQVETAPLREPKGRFQETIRRLAEAAMDACHHDANEAEEGYIHEMQSMERAFTNILRGFMSAETKRRNTTPGSAEPRGCPTVGADVAAWIEQRTTLHQQVDILYVVDGYEVSIMNDRCRTVAGPWRGETVAEALRLAMGVSE